MRSEAAAVAVAAHRRQDLFAASYGGAARLAPIDTASGG